MNRWIITVIIICFFGLTACQKESDEQNKSENGENTEQIPTSNTPTEKEESKEPITITLVHPHTFEIVGTISPEELGYESNFVQYINEIEAYAKKLARGTDNEEGYDQLMVLDKIDENGQLIKGTPRVILKESELIDKIIAASEKGGRVFLPLYVTESNYRYQEVADLNETVVASYTTYFNGSEVGRSKNIELSAKALNQIIIGDGDYFSFNTMVGERTPERGYQPAPEIINKELVMGIGGGICQTSSTLFNALDLTNINITERHHHSISIGYVPKGRDATVSFGTLDFKFENTSGVPFIIKTIYKPGSLTVEIRTAARYVSELKK